MLGTEPHAHPLEPAHVQVDRARADLIAAGQAPPGPDRAARAAGPRITIDARICRTSSCGASTPSTVVASSVGDAPGQAHRHAEVLEHLGHDRAVADARDVRDHAAAGRQQRGGHQLERGVLRPRHLHGAGQTGAPGHEEAIHGSMVPGRGRGTAQPASLIRAMRLRDLAFRDAVVSSADAVLPLLEAAAGSLHVDLVGELGVRGQHVGPGHTLVRGHVQEPAVDRRPPSRPRPAACAAARSRAAPAAGRARPGCRPRRRPRARSAPGPRRPRPPARG